MSEIMKTGECEVCEKSDIKITCHYGNMWFCDDCWKKEEQYTKENQSPENQQARVLSVTHPIKNAVETAEKIDSSIEIRTDLFNAATVAIVDLKKSIDENPEITNKPYALAEILKKRFEHFQEVVFDLRKQEIEATNNQRAIQVYLNNLANQLRAEEREKLRIADINYKPAAIKEPKVKSVTTRQTSKKTKIDKVSLRKAASELGISEFTLQMLCVSQGLSVEDAVKKLRDMQANHSSK